MFLRSSWGSRENMAIFFVKEKSRVVTFVSWRYGTFLEEEKKRILLSQIVALVLLMDSFYLVVVAIDDEYHDLRKRVARVFFLS